jgi:hypothetical protein
MNGMDGMRVGMGDALCMQCMEGRDRLTGFHAMASIQSAHLCPTHSTCSSICPSTCSSTPSGYLSIYPSIHPICHLTQSLPLCSHVHQLPMPTRLEISNPIPQRTSIHPFIIPIHNQQQQCRMSYIRSHRHIGYKAIPNCLTLCCVYPPSPPVPLPHDPHVCTIQYKHTQP